MSITTTYEHGSYHAVDTVTGVEAWDSDADTAINIIKRFPEILHQLFGWENGDE